MSSGVTSTDQVKAISPQGAAHAEDEESQVLSRNWVLNRWGSQVERALHNGETEPTPQAIANLL